MNVFGTAARPSALRPARAQAPVTPEPSSPAPGDLEGLSASAYGGLARSYRETGKADQADQYTLSAVKAAKDGTEALRYANQRYGPKADASHGMNQYVRSDAPYVASPAVQVKGAELAAAKFTSFDNAAWALRYHPAQTPEANTVMLKRIVDLAADRDQVRDLTSLVKLLGTPEAVAYAEAAMNAKPKPSFWTKLNRILQSI